MKSESRARNLEPINQQQDYLLGKLVQNLAANPVYKAKFESLGLVPEDIKSVEDLPKLPLSTKEDLRQNYPLGLQIAPEKDVVRVHSSSGTTGTPVLIPYTRKDVNIWAEMMARCFTMVGIREYDRIQITPGYGLWTAGIGFQAGAELLGAMAVPIGPGNTERQLKTLVDLKTSVLIGTSSYGLLLAEEAERAGLIDKLNLKIGVFGSERWGDKMRTRIEDMLGIDTFDIYGLTEIYGPGIAIDCPCHSGLHYWDDHLIFEIIDPVTGEQLPPGCKGELVITTLTKEGMPLLRFRTRDITRIIPASCACGSPYPMIDRIVGRSDDMIKVKGVQLYPSEIEILLSSIPDLSSEYQIEIDRHNGKERAVLRVERKAGCLSDQELSRICQREIKNQIGLTMDVELVEYNSLPRTEKKTKRVLDKRTHC